MIWPLTAALVVALVLAERTGHTSQRLLKPLASASFLAIGILSLDGSGYATVILIGLGLGALGDTLLLGTRRWFLAGLGAFLLGHLSYVVAFAVAGPSSVGYLLIPVVAASIAGVLRWLWPHVPPRMRGPVVAYHLAIGAMVCASPVHRLVTLAAVLFAVSDVLVARDRFVRRTWNNRLIGLPLYYGAQVLLALSPRWV